VTNETYVKNCYVLRNICYVNKKDLQLLQTLILLFTYKSILKNTEFYIL